MANGAVTGMIPLAQIREMAGELGVTNISVSRNEANDWYQGSSHQAPANDNCRLSMEAEDVREVLAIFMVICRERVIDPIWDDAEGLAAFSDLLVHNGWHPALQLHMMEHVDALWPQVAPFDPADVFEERADNVVILGY